MKITAGAANPFPRPPPAACRVAAAAAPPPVACLPSAAATAEVQGRLLHPVVTTLPSLLGWQPGASMQRPLQQAALGGSGRGHPLGPYAAATPAAAAYSTLSDSISITPAIEAQLQNIQQRHADLLQQLSGNAMSKWVGFGWRRRWHLVCGIACPCLAAPLPPAGLTSALLPPPTYSHHLHQKHCRCQAGAC